MVHLELVDEMVNPTQDISKQDTDKINVDQRLCQSLHLDIAADDNRRQHLTIEYAPHSRNIKSTSL